MVSEEIGYSRPIIYAWKRLYDQKEAAAFMRYQDIPRGKLEEPSNSTSEEIAELNKYSLPELLKIMKIAESSYYYLKKSQVDKYRNLRIKIRDIFEKNRYCYGYRRVHAILSREDIRVSEKVVRRLMNEENIAVKIRRARKYNSYKGEITPAVENIVARDFQAKKPNENWLSDLTEFAIPAGKIYLSPIVDCFDGFIPSWTIGTSPNAILVNKMLLKGINKLKPDEKPILHTDRGCHYRWQSWIDIIKRFGLTRSMSAKGCSLDNSACEGLFGRLKNEFFYGRDWSHYSTEDFFSALNEYIAWYNEVRIKKSLRFLSPLEFRQKMGLVV